jgi:alpha-glucoside transport system permease protein
VDDRVVTAILAVIIVPIVLYGYIWLGELLLSRLSSKVAMRLRPYLWVAPAVAFATVFLVFPTINTIIISFQNKNSTQWVGLQNYVYFFTNPDTLGALKNNVLWLVFFTFFVVAGGLVIAVLFDRIKYETIAKTCVFLPLPISAVAASIIWKFMFEYQPVGNTQTGTLNAVLGTVGFDPVAWTVNQSLNNGALIFVGIWASTGFAMVIISASLKAISPELLEAARVDGATELRILRSVIIPLLMPTITIVTTTMIIVAIKVFDIVYTLTAGAYGTDVIATQMLGQLTSGSPQYGRAAAVGVILLLAVMPVLFINLRRFRQLEELR